LRSVAASNSGTTRLDIPHQLVLTVRGGDVQDPATGGWRLSDTDPGSVLPTAGSAPGGPAPPSGPAGGDAFSDLPPLPQPKSGTFPLGTEVGFQLVNCTDAALDVKTFNQNDGVRMFPNKTYKVEPKAGVNCYAAANGDPFDIQYTVNGQLARARQSTRVYAIQVGPYIPDHGTVFVNKGNQSHGGSVSAC
jgi:hypothetical protein